MKKYWKEKFRLCLIKVWKKNTEVQNRNSRTKIASSTSEGEYNWSGPTGPCNFLGNETRP